jgi:hypothetical protein
MNLTLSIEEETLRKARKRAETMGTSVDQLVREYLEGLTGAVDREALANEFERLSREAHGNSRGWKFNRDELYERR